MRTQAVLLAAVLLQAPVPCALGDLPSPADERARIAAHGPWPLPAQVDPSNRVSGHPAAAALGERLFASPSLSGPGSVSCATCHAGWRHFTDGRPRALGVEPGDRNTLSVLNAAHYHAFGWDGSQPTLWQQSIRPLRDASEMRSSAGHVAAVMRGDPLLAEMYRSAFGTPLPADDEALLLDVGKALAAYQETLTTGRTPFDEYRDALARGDAEAAARYPAPAQRGLHLFVGKAACAACHAGPMFSDSAFHPSRIVSARHDGRPDAGHGGGTFRTPGLREVAATGPYMHDGSIASLCDALRPHAGTADQAPPLTTQDRRDLVEFLRTLTVDTELPFADASIFQCH
jgi:cytochrome c peroxidase